MADPTIRGTDGAVPTYNPNGLWAIWNWDDVYWGLNALNKYVPKVNDYIRNITSNKTYRVTAVSDLLIPSYVDIDSTSADVGSSVLIGLGQQPVSMRCFLDTSKLPYEISIDTRHYINGSTNTYARLFKGYDITSNGTVISALFSGTTYIDDKIPLELVAYDDHTNLAEKCVPTFYTKANLADGEVVTLAIYDATNTVTSVTICVIEKTSFIRPVNAAQKYITGITLDSIFLSDTDPYVLNYPLNVPLGSLNMNGVIHYSDGSEKLLPVDGTKFSVYGIEKFVATRAGQKVPIVLNYRLDTNEPTYVGVSTDGNRITVDYSLFTTVENGIYSPVLFGYPRWSATDTKYVMHWWLMDLDRDIVFDATDYVQYNESSTIFDGNNYTQVQFLSVRVNLTDISQALPNWIHTQTLYVKLTDPTLSVPNLAKFEVGEENVAGQFYGTSLTARTLTVNVNNFQVDISNNIGTLDEWLKQLYYNARPVYSLYRETQAPAPTHFSIYNDKNNIQTFPVSVWGTTFNVFTNLQGQSNLIIRWEKQITDADPLLLAVTEIPFEFIT